MNIKDIKKGQTVNTIRGIGTVDEVVTEGRLAPFARIDTAEGRHDLKPDEITMVIHQPPDDPEVLPEVAKPRRLPVDGWHDDPREED